MTLSPFRRSLARCAAVLVFLAGAAATAAAEPAPRRLGVGLYGANGHQLAAAKLADHPHARLVAAAGLPPARVPGGVRRHDSLDALLADPAVEIVSLCSPRRADQARDAIRCLEAGRHVYAEKPAALTEADLDRILAAATRAGKQFHEMAGTAFSSHYAMMRRLVRDGAVGEVVQIHVQKSYRYGAARPQDEDIDGGMFLQAGIHAARLVEHVGGVRMRSLTGWETTFGKPPGQDGAGKSAAAAQAVLENGGLATITMNYLNPPGTTLPHGNESLRVFGTKGYVESIDGGQRMRLVTAGKITEPHELGPATDYFDFVAAHLARGDPMPLTLDEELHPLRQLLRAKEALRAGAR
ncbi:MAG: Gfo/Idh/MocA family oxidoreductase [Opitutaceae bacterium]|nr:Gfo/Idh/MocA family oxidoreductase [Opitutaceae bacterium]